MVGAGKTVSSTRLERAEGQRQVHVMDLLPSIAWSPGMRVMKEGDWSRMDSNWSTDTALKLLECGNAWLRKKGMLSALITVRIYGTT